MSISDQPWTPLKVNEYYGIKQDWVQPEQEQFNLLIPDITIILVLIGLYKDMSYRINQQTKQ